MLAAYLIGAAQRRRTLTRARRLGYADAMDDLAELDNGDDAPPPCIDCGSLLAYSHNDGCRLDGQRAAGVLGVLGGMHETGPSPQLLAAYPTCPRCPEGARLLLNGGPHCPNCGWSAPRDDGDGPPTQGGLTEPIPLDEPGEEWADQLAAMPHIASEPADLPRPGCSDGRAAKATGLATMPAGRAGPGQPATQAVLFSIGAAACEVLAPRRGRAAGGAARRARKRANKAAGVARAAIAAPDPRSATFWRELGQLTDDAYRRLGEQRLAALALLEQARQAVPA